MRNPLDRFPGDAEPQDVNRVLRDLTESLANTRDVHAARHASERAKWLAQAAEWRAKDLEPTPPVSRLADLEARLIAASQAGDTAEHARIRQEIREAGLPALAAELDRIASGPPEPALLDTPPA